MKRGKVTTDMAEIQKIVTDYRSNYIPIKWTTWKKLTNS